MEQPTEQPFGSEARYVRGRYLASIAKSNLWEAFRRDPNIIGAAFGRRIVGGTFTDEPALVVYVARKVPASSVPSARLLPRRIYIGNDPIEVDVFETGPIFAQSFTARERPAHSGISCTRAADMPIDAGTLGCLVRDNTDESLNILSCNHVLANENAGAIGDVIVQQATLDGGSSPGDDIAKLKRFVMINATGNTVDCAIAQVNDEKDVIDQMENNLMPVATSDHPAVGLLFAGGCNRTLMNPITDVLTQLNIRFPSGGNSTIAPEVGMNVEKVGRTTEYTTSTITEIDVTVTISYNFGPATFDHQIATSWMSDPGDSGSLICRGGAGGKDDHCGGGGVCQSTSSAQSIVGTDLTLDALVEKEFREKYLLRTRVGRYVVDLFFRNEDYLVGRLQRADVKKQDRTYVQSLYNRYIADIRTALVAPERSDLKLTATHLRDARQLLRRAEKYMDAREVQAAENLLKLASRFKGQTVSEVLARLNDEELLEEVRETVARVPALDRNRQGR